MTKVIKFIGLPGRLAKFVQMFPNDLLKPHICQCFFFPLGKFSIDEAKWQWPEVILVGVFPLWSQRWRGNHLVAPTGLVSSCPGERGGLIDDYQKSF